MNLSSLAKPKITIRKHTDDLLKQLNNLYNLGYINNRTYVLMEKICEYHDYGKDNECFQKRVKSNGKIKFNNKKEVSHNILSVLFIKRNWFENKKDYYLTCYAVLNHHHYVDNFVELRNKRELISGFTEKRSLDNITTRSIKGINEVKNDNEAILLKGLLHKCDYSASGNYQIEYVNNFLAENTKKFILNDLNSELNSLQKYCQSSTDENIITIANTGMGKTEAGLLWIGDNKGFFILPLRTAVNAIYDRILRKIVKKNKEERIALLHSDTVEYYMNHEWINEGELELYSSRSKQLSMPITVTTLDQIFNFVYKYNGSELKLATLSYSKIVIDEIQAYSPDLLAYLIIGLESIVKLGGKFAILTATMPPFIRFLLEESVGKIKYNKFVEGDLRHNMHILDNKIDHEFEMIWKHYENKGGKTLIICNTVKKAQMLYDKFQDAGIETQLFHSKFIKKDRSYKEDMILIDGKTDLTGDLIWITTSIVEASLDIDFDYLFTELNDLNGLFQRMGRVNRKGSLSKNKMLEAGNVYVFTQIDTNLLVSKNSNKGFIDKKIFELSRRALLSRGHGKIEEIEKYNLIEKTLTFNEIKDSYFYNKYSEIKTMIDNLYIGEKEIDEVKKEFRNIISFKVMPESVYLDNEEMIRKVINIYNNKSINTMERKKLKKQIDDLTLNVQYYEYRKPDIVKIIKLMFDNISVIKCSYNKNIGFKKNVDEEKGGVFI